MPDWRTFFDHKWVRAWDLGGKELTVKIERVEAGVLENAKAKKKDRAPIVWFKGAKKPLALNRTNSKTIAAMFGNNTDDWIGKSVTIYPTTTSFGNDTVDCIRVRPRVPTAKPSDMPNPEPPAEAGREPGTDDSTGEVLT